MMSRTYRFFAVFLTLTIAGVSTAENAPETAPERYDEPGLYIAVQAGVALLRDDVSVHFQIDNVTRVDYDADVDPAPVVGARLGYRWSHWALEGDLDYVIGDVNSFNLTLNGRWYPWTHRIQPYLMVGMGISYVRPVITDGSGETQFGETVFAMRGGIGAEFYLTEHWYTDVGVIYHYVSGPANRSDGASHYNQSYLGVRGGIGYRFF